MSKKSYHRKEFKLSIVKEHLQGGSITSLAIKHGLSKSLLTRWVDRYNMLGEEGLLPRVPQSHSSIFKLKVVESYLNNGLSLRDCCLDHGIANESIVLSWVKKYELSGLAGLREQRGRPRKMKDNTRSKKKKPLTRLEELEQENLYLRAENELLKKLEALAQEKKAQEKKR